MAAAQLLQSIDGGLVLLVGDSRLPAGHDFPPEGQAQHADACRVERYHTSASEWFLCVRHRWCERLAVGTVRALSCPHEGR